MAKGRWAVGRSEESVAYHYAVNKARGRAKQRLMTRHREEFDALFAEEKSREQVSLRPALREGRCSRCDLPIDSGTICEFCEEWDESHG